MQADRFRGRKKFRWMYLCCLLKYLIFEINEEKQITIRNRLLCS